MRSIPSEDRFRARGSSNSAFGAAKAATLPLKLPQHLTDQVPRCNTQEVRHLVQRSSAAESPPGCSERRRRQVLTAAARHGGALGGCRQCPTTCPPADPQSTVPAGPGSGLPEPTHPPDAEWAEQPEDLARPTGGRHCTRRPNARAKLRKAAALTAIETRKAAALTAVETPLLRIRDTQSVRALISLHRCISGHPDLPAGQRAVHHNGPGGIGLREHTVPHKLRGVLLHQVAGPPLVRQLLVSFVPRPAERQSIPSVGHFLLQPDDGAAASVGPHHRDEGLQTT